MSVIEILQLIGAPVAVYVAIRVDMAAMKVRLDHLERDIYSPLKHPK
jgi:hypothetical protein